MNDLHLHIEAVLFTAEEPVGLNELTKSLQSQHGDGVTKESVLASLTKLKEKYAGADFAFELMEIGGGYSFLTKRNYYKTVSSFLHETARKRLSSAAMETLSIIAYKEPVTKSEVEAIRGVSCDYTIHKLMEKELVTMLGKQDSPGRPILYGVSQSFLDYFGINSTKDLPQLKELQPKADNSIGQEEEA